MVHLNFPTKLITDLYRGDLFIKQGRDISPYISSFFSIKTKAF
ncbi:hypothetical protein SAMD00020551_3114 [Mesobacillus selenatarsenatis SF-1]|uniref:Uncharacterized protein n=1 Tax=Mesobacillus selenatarsenatis (strain DSM 18680 / JCM 14380 / FERM P-15431 / SF-1) TaxID=1321606 RepID=A0A0A8X4X6_MESS1|nr:hypothetical protein SAMD00020551_3114 [Mesobacillus selenatarsenatis SF-1]